MTRLTLISSPSFGHPEYPIGVGPAWSRDADAPLGIVAAIEPSIDDRILHTRQNPPGAS